MIDVKKRQSMLAFFLSLFQQRTMNFLLTLKTASGRTSAFLGLPREA
jgi:hypothetical protein